MSPAPCPADNSPSARHCRLHNSVLDLVQQSQEHRRMGRSSGPSTPEVVGVSTFPLIISPPPAPIGFVSRTAAAFTISVVTNDSAEPHYAIFVKADDDAVTYGSPALIPFYFGFGFGSLNPSNIPSGATQIKVRVYGDATVVASYQITLNVVP